MQAPAAVSAASKLWFFVSLSFQFQGGLPRDLNSLVNLRKFVGFQFVQLFSYYEDEGDNFQVLYMWDWKLEVQVSIMDYQIFCF